MITELKWDCGLPVLIDECVQRINDVVKTYVPLNIFPIPRGGVPVALLVKERLEKGHCKATIVSDPTNADIIIDDIIDSGATRQKYVQNFPDTPFFALIDKRTEKDWGWVVFPWEIGEEQNGPQENVRRLLEYIGEDPNREGLVDTPGRVIRSYDEMFRGYHENVNEIFTEFEDGACDEMAVLRGCEFVSFCEHHMLPVIGKAHIGYIPDGKVVGISKLARVLDVYARRLQLQERLTQQVTKCLDEHLQPLGSACVIDAKHHCMICRGVQKQKSSFITSSLTGAFRKPEVRQEFLALIGLSE